MNRLNWSFEAIGTSWRIEGELPEGIKEAEISKIIEARISNFDKSYSRFRKDSLIFEISEKPGKYKLDSDGKKMIELYQKLYKITSGKFTPLIGKTLEEAGYDSEYSFKVGEISKVSNWDESIEYRKGELLVKRPVMLDFGGIGKGFLIDVISEILENKGVINFCIDGGGDIFTQGKEYLKVGLEHPDNPERVIGVARVKNQSICASSGNRRKWGKFHHIVNPKTLSSPTEILATWVIAENALIADGMATCLFLESETKLRKKFEFEYLILYPNYTFKKSDNFNAEVFVS